MFSLIPFHNRRQRGLVNIDDFFENFFNGFGELTDPVFNSVKTDIKETEKEYIVQAELPGFKKDNIHVDLNNDYLTITAENNEIIEEENNNYIRKERRTGKFQRSFYVKDIKQDEIDAKYENGILEIKLPKAHPGLNNRRIEIH